MCQFNTLGVLGGGGGSITPVGVLEDKFVVFNDICWSVGGHLWGVHGHLVP